MMHIFIFVMLILIGIVNIIFPSIGWYLKHGWAVDGDSEPSDTYLFMTKFGGVIAVVIGSILLIISFFI
ncbi:DUF6199 family natural product biosynthesis protein [Paenibacillus harenae]|uniref:DUF6199 family natural product biosynthesis protein n=1 Tax=Paenibacillus harenae TaxID=306543 RepID=UPI00041A4B38|nr:DUF6199 family natural product biosynthesis protein [Paenibacillus harenae]